VRDASAYITVSRRVLALSDRPTAILADSDLQAFGLYEAARPGHGLVVRQSTAAPEGSDPS
jgi:hypothetical protein